MGLLELLTHPESAFAFLGHPTAAPTPASPLTATAGGPGLFSGIQDRTDLDAGALPGRTSVDGFDPQTVAGQKLALLAATAPHTDKEAGGMQPSPDAHMTPIDVAKMGNSTASTQQKAGLLSGVSNWLQTPHIGGLTGWDMLTGLGGALSNSAGDNPQAVTMAAQMIARNRDRRDNQAVAGQFDKMLYGPAEPPAPQPNSSVSDGLTPADKQSVAAAPTARQRATAAKRMLSLAASRGANVAPYQQLLKGYEEQADREDYLNSLSPKDRVGARLNPNAYIEAGVRSGEHKFVDLSGRVVDVDPASHTATEIYTAPSKPPEGWEFGPSGGLKPIKGGPYDVGYVETKSQAEARGQRAGSPPEWVAHPETAGPTSSPTRVLGPIFAKLAQSGWGSLSQSEQEAIRYYKMDPLTAQATGDIDIGAGGPPKPAPAATNSGTFGVPAAAQRKEGGVYRTPKGPMTWRGGKWYPAGAQ